MHVATLWEITLAADTGFLTPVVTVFSATYLTTIPVINGLIPLTDYLVRATYYDDMGATGVGSATPFTTLAANLIPEPGTFAAATQGCGDC